MEVFTMKRIKSVNGYTIYQATARDAAQDCSLEAGYFYLYFSSDIRDYGRAYSYVEFEAGSLEEAEALATGTNYAAAREYVEANSTAATYEEIEAVEKLLDSGMSADEIAAAEEEADEIECVQAIRVNNLFYVLRDSAQYIGTHGPYFTMEAADNAARNYAENTGVVYLAPADNQ